VVFPNAAGGGALETLLLPAAYCVIHLKLLNAVSLSGFIWLPLAEA
jgi:hypothetical protein